MAREDLAEVKRAPGRPKKLNRDGMRDLAQAKGPDAIKTIDGLMRKSKNPNVRLMAARELLDRAYGKPALPIGADPDGPNLFEGFMAAIAGKQRPIIGGK